jgi:hypothetical protein
MKMFHENSLLISYIYIFDEYSSTAAFSWLNHVKSHQSFPTHSHPQNPLGVTAGLATAPCRAASSEA